MGGLIGGLCAMDGIVRAAVQRGASGVAYATAAIVALERNAGLLIAHPLPQAGTVRSSQWQQGILCAALA